MDWNFSTRVGAETALDACDYYLTDAENLMENLDFPEKMRLVKHEELRSAVTIGNLTAVVILLNALGDEKEIIVNLTPKGANTLLYISSQYGFEEIAKLLINAGADGRSHTITKYSPLYAAVYHGHYNISKLLLDTFPELIQQLTVERWSPLHSACINLHTNIVELLINYEYPKKLYHSYRDEDGLWEWKLAFDPNQQDVTGQNCLYIASILGNIHLVNCLLNWKVKCYRVEFELTCRNPPETPTRIQSILSKLSIHDDSENEDEKKTIKEICPIRLNLLCGAAQETALLAAVRGGFLDVVGKLLEFGADPNVVAKPVEDPSNPRLSEEIYGLSNVPLTEACKQNSARMVDILLRYGAKDNQSLGLSIAISNIDETIINKLLTKRVYPDSDYKINKKSLPLPTDLRNFMPSSSSVTYSSLFPNTPTIIDWHNNNNAKLSSIKMEWVVQAVLELNPKLQNNSKIDHIVLTAITRIDLSHNAILCIPSELFTLTSLKYLNIAQNKLEKLPSDVKYNCPVLEEIFLQDNNLLEIPSQLFQLPSLVTLDISNNKLQELPFEMWKAPKLREINLAFNLLRDLPISIKSIKKSNSKVNTPIKRLESVSSEWDRTKNFNFTIITHRNMWSNVIETIETDIKWNAERKDEEISHLSSINIANNLFTAIPVSLACLAINLTRLNLSYNSLRSMGHVTSYPRTLRQLDLSHNEITCWPSLPRISELECYNPECNHDDSENSTEVSFQDEDDEIERNKNDSLRNTILKNVCFHRKHLRFENLKTLILADNILTRIQLSTDDVPNFNESDDLDWHVIGITKAKLIFPNLSMLDISNNCLKEIPTSISELSSLSVLNISGNVDVTDLPKQLGLLNRLWNLNMRGCSLQDPLKSMVESKKYKTMDIIGYLKSIYEDAQPYARMKLMVVGVQGIGKTTLLELLRNESTQKSKGPDHWSIRVSKRQSQSSSSQRKSNYNISTVGVDIGNWICDKKRNKSSSYYGPVIFRTWDFGGQKEYYATHQYFLSKRSLYLVLWKISDGYKGLTEVLLWLGNIQTRAPNSPVIIVGTYYDTIGENFSVEYADEMQKIIRERFISVPDAEKIGLPKVIDTIQISCSTLHNIKYLMEIIYDTAFSLRSPSSKQPLLMQKVPASYIALEDAVTNIAVNMRSSDIDPVVDTDTFKKLITDYMNSNDQKCFRDWSEFNQAVMFLHDNGVMLHYDDASLKNFYFLDPQWLCDMLAHIVTIREINPFVKNGIMRVDDLEILYKHNYSNSFKSYIINLLNKFEVALTWDSKTLVIPSLLPTGAGGDGITIKVFQKNKRLDLDSGGKQNISNTLTFKRNNTNNKKSLRRILLMTYFPSGFWPRILTRMLSDDQITEAIKSLYNLKPLTDPQIKSDFDLRKAIDDSFHWKLWQTGISLHIGNIKIFHICEIPINENSVYRNSRNRYKVKLDNVWNDLNISSTSILEMYFDIKDIDLYQIIQNKYFLIGINYVKVNLICKLLALIVDQIDLLLEDWYPQLGTRFVHTSEGRFLITRLIFCPHCFDNLIGNPDIFNTNIDNELLEKYDMEMNLKHFKNSKSQDSTTSTSDRDSGVEKGSKESIDSTVEIKSSSVGNKIKVCYSWMIEECILTVYNKTKITCPVHSNIDLMDVAPDVIFADIFDKYLISSESIIKGPLLGRGAFGFVFKAACKVNNINAIKSVAMKMLQPVPPGNKAKNSALVAYKVSLNKWNRDPLQYSCKAYCTARQELAVLLNLKHPNIVSLIGICVRPLSIVLELAPMGGLDSILRQYRRSGARLGYYTFYTTILQCAKAIEYLHRKKIIYRDLKSENILVWDFPAPHSEDGIFSKVNIKVADYGISRISSPSGSKGFGGTEGFMAPEICRYNGEEEYTEKVDCFSFGMFLYECITLRQPFEGQESIKEFILEGNRPLLSSRETQFPTYYLDLMALCWNESPQKRPSASQIVSILNAPECKHLLDAVVLPNDKVEIGMFKNNLLSKDSSEELILFSSNQILDILRLSSNGYVNQHSFTDLKKTSKDLLKINEQNVKFSCSCIVDDTIWIGDSYGRLRVFNLMDFNYIYAYIFDTSTIQPIISMQYLKNLQRVVIGLENGRVFLVISNMIPSDCASGEGSFVLTEISSGDSLNSACVADLKDGVYELWFGGQNSAINIFQYNNSGVCKQMNISHNIPKQSCYVSHLTASSQYVFSCVSCEYAIYQWDILTKKNRNKLDCSKLLPCSESLQSLSIEEYLTKNKSQITALSIKSKEIYIGTVLGCIIVVDIATLRPITIFRPYENNILSIIPLYKDNLPIIATLGLNYRPLFSRYLDNDQKIYYNHIEDQHFKNPDLKKKIHCLIWNVQNWN